MLNSSPELPAEWQVLEPPWTHLPCLFFSNKWAPGSAKEHSPQCCCPEPAHVQPLEHQASIPRQLEFPCVYPGKSK